MAGLIYIDTNGNATFGADASFTQNVTVQGNLATHEVSSLPGQNLTLNLGNRQASGSSQLNNGNLQVVNSSGSGVLTLDQNGNLTASGAATFDKLNLDTTKAVLALSNTEMVATGSAGTAQITANQNQVTIDDPLVTANSLIYITSVGQTNGASLSLLNQVANDPAKNVKGSFTVGISFPVSNNVKFNFLIIN